MKVLKPTPINDIPPVASDSRGVFNEVWKAVEAHDDKTTAITIRCVNSDQARSLVRRAKEKEYTATQRAEVVYIYKK